MINKIKVYFSQPNILVKENVTSFIGLFFSFLTFAFVSKVLGPEFYGLYSFIINYGIIFIISFHTGMDIYLINKLNKKTNIAKDIIVLFATLNIVFICSLIIFLSILYFFVNKNLVSNAFFLIVILYTQNILFIILRSCKELYKSILFDKVLRYIYLLIIYVFYCLTSTQNSFNLNFFLGSYSIATLINIVVFSFFIGKSSQKIFFQLFRLDYFSFRFIKVYFCRFKSTILSNTLLLSEKLIPLNFLIFSNLYFEAGLFAFLFSLCGISNVLMLNMQFKIDPFFPKYIKNNDINNLNSYLRSMTLGMVKLLIPFNISFILMMYFFLVFFMQEYMEIFPYFVFLIIVQSGASFLGIGQRLMILNKNDNVLLKLYLISILVYVFSIIIFFDVNPLFITILGFGLLIMIRAYCSFYYLYKNYNINSSIFSLKRSSFD